LEFPRARELPKNINDWQVVNLAGQEFFNTLLPLVCCGWRMAKYLLAVVKEEEISRWPPLYAAPNLWSWWKLTSEGNQFLKHGGGVLMTRMKPHPLQILQNPAKISIIEPD
jgi:hypothetical protein